MGHPDAHAGRAGDHFHPGVELMREGVDNGCPQPVAQPFRIAAAFSDPVIGHGQFPICAIDLVSYEHRCAGLVVGKGVFNRVDQEFGDNEADADRLGRIRSSPHRPPTLIVMALTVSDHRACPGCSQSFDK